MEILSIKNLSFRYPQSEKCALRDISLTVKEGTFTLICGATGSGKSTLLNLIKPSVTPNGEKSGEILFCGKSIDSLDEREECESIAYVFQRCDAQLVSESVWANIAFALENMGIAPEKMRQRIGECALFLGIEKLFSRSVNTLSGGEKQLVNLAGALVMRPKLLLLDEPSAQLDAAAAAAFIDVCTRLCRETGMSIIATEHETENIFARSDEIVVLKNGEALIKGAPHCAAEAMQRENILCSALPAAARIFPKSGILSVSDAREELLKKGALCTPKRAKVTQGNTALQLKDVWFRYKKDAPDVLHGVNYEAHFGAVNAILGSNGVGKSTLLSLVASSKRAYRGKVIKNASAALLPQDARTLFLSDKLCEEIETEYAKELSIEHLLNANPYDLSGGELQKAALAKLLSQNAQIILLDEPTKGVDCEARLEIQKILRAVAQQGKCVIIVTHDVEFASACSDVSALLFDGEIFPPMPTRDFFSENCFYTTAARSISRGIIANAVTCDDILTAMEGTI